jgi:hypothetical protein
MKLYISCVPLYINFIYGHISYYINAKPFYRQNSYSYLNVNTFLKVGDCFETKVLCSFQWCIYVYPICAWSSLKLRISNSDNRFRESEFFTLLFPSLLILGPGIGNSEIAFSILNKYLKGIQDFKNFRVRDIEISRFESRIYKTIKVLFGYLGVPLVSEYVLLNFL